MAQVTPSSPSLAGTVLTANAASAGGDSVANLRGDVLLRITNGGGAPITCTVAAQLTSRQGDGVYPTQTVANNVITIANGVTRIAGPFPAAFNDGNGNLQLTWSATSSVTFDALKPT